MDSPEPEHPSIWSLLVEAVYRLFADEAIPLAGNIAFRTIFSVFPFLIFLTTLGGFLGNAELAEEIKDPKMARPLFSKTAAGQVFLFSDEAAFAKYRDQIKKENRVNKVGVFVNAPIENVLQMVDECRLHMVQLHGDESVKYCEKIADYISVVKAFRLSETDNIEWRIKDYMDVCDMFMFDTEGAGYGGTSKKFDWNKLKDITIGKPYFLSGGIEPDDTEKLKTFVKLPEAKALFAIDINSKFETLPGIKDLALIEKFIKSFH